jgi:GNAT superfamily N-acetyltransferase
MTSIIEIKTYSPEYHEAMQRFLNQLTTSPMVLTESMFHQLLASENSHLFFIMKDEQIAGMLTVGIYYSPTGGKAWIEDVVVDETFRGQGLSKQLVAHAIEFVKSKQIPLLMLTSNPKRIAANKLYQAMGFERKETNVYRMKLRMEEKGDIVEFLS